MAPEPRKLVDQLGPDPRLGELRALLVTTYNLSASFVDGDLLPALLGSRVRFGKSRQDRIALERRLASLEAAVVLMDARPFEARPESLRIELHPGHQPTIQHSKVSVLVYEKGVRLTVGSANLSDAGYRKNREVACVLTASAAQRAHLPLIRQALAGAREALGPWWVPSADRVIALATATLDRFEAPKEPDPSLQFVWLGPSLPRLTTRLVSAWPGGRIDRITVVSPYWSDDGRPLPQLLKALGDRVSARTRLDFLAERRVLPDGTALPEVPAGLLGLSVPHPAGVWCVDPTVSAAEVGRADVALRRRLHAKMVLLEGDKHALLYAGSANFTAPAWGYAGQNAEAGVFLFGAPELLRGLLPPRIGDPAPLGQESPRDLGGTDPADKGLAPWPKFLRSVVLSVAGDALVLDVDVDEEKVCGAWSVSESGVTLLSGPSTQAVVTQHRAALMSTGSVTVTWWEGERAFPLNVSLETREALPLSADGRPPGEDELLAYYLGQIAYEDAFPGPGSSDGGGDGDDDAPSTAGGVDTSQIQSYQVRRFVEALPGMLQELARSAGVPTAYRQSLLGPVSPRALGERVLQLHQSGARSVVAAFFQLEELRALLVRARGLPAPEAHAEGWATIVGESIGHIDGFIAALGPPPPAVQLFQKALRAAP